MGKCFTNNETSITYSDLLVGRTLVDLRRPGFPVRVANISDFSRTIPEGIELAKCELVESLSTGDRSTRPTTNNGIEVPSHVRQ